MTGEELKTFREYVEDHVDSDGVGETMHRALELIDSLPNDGKGNPVAAGPVNTPTVWFPAGTRFDTSDDELEVVTEAKLYHVAGGQACVIFAAADECDYTSSPFYVNRADAEAACRNNHER